MGAKNPWGVRNLGGVKNPLWGPESLGGRDLGSLLTTMYACKLLTNKLTELFITLTELIFLNQSCQHWGFGPVFTLSLGMIISEIV